jgi:hypothetical protein
MVTHFIPYGSYISNCGYIEDLRYPEKQSDMRKDVTCLDCQSYMTDQGDFPKPIK